MTDPDRPRPELDAFLADLGAVLGAAGYQTIAVDVTTPTAAQVTIQCEGCGVWAVRPVSDPEALPRYCGRKCRLRARRKAREAILEGFCQAHQQIEPGARWPRAGVYLCLPARAVWYMSCRRKVRHPDEVSASEAAEQTAADGGECGVYGCPICEGWHVTRRLESMPSDWAASVKAVAAAVRAAGLPAHPSLVANKTHG